MASKTDKKTLPRKLPGRLGMGGWIYGGRYWIERYAYLFHRITGLALISYLILHIFVVGERVKGQETWDALMAMMTTPFAKVLEFLLLLAFLYHAINGFRLLFIEFGFFIGKPARPTYPYKTSIKAQRPFLYLLMMAGAVMIGLSVVEFFHLR